MKSEELMRGNLITLTDEAKEEVFKSYVGWGNVEYACLVDEIKEDEVSVLIQDKDTNLYEYLPINYYRPIPLTEEWLLKLGYEEWESVIENEYESYKRFVIYNIVEGTSSHEVHLITSNYGGDIQKEFITSIDNNERQRSWRMEFVHDLQNAFFKEVGLRLELVNAN